MGFKVHNQEASECAPYFITSFPSRFTKFADDALDLRCTVSGTPNPVITWKFNGQTISGNNPRILCLNGNRRLLVRILTADDAGVYTCIARNQHGEVSRSCDVIVRANPPDEPPRILEHPRDISVVEGQQTTISCLATVPRSLLYAFVWIKDGQILKETRRCKYDRECLNDHTIKATYTIRHARFEDEGNYMLKINTCNDSVVSNQAHLDTI